jgi:hypothetical protein
MISDVEACHQDPGQARKCPLDNLRVSGGNVGWGLGQGLQKTHYEQINALSMRDSSFWYF